MIELRTMYGLANVRFEPEDTLRDIASVMNCTVNDLCNLMNILYDRKWDARTPITVEGGDTE